MLALSCVAAMMREGCLGSFGSCRRRKPLGWGYNVQGDDPRTLSLAVVDFGVEAPDTYDTCGLNWTLECRFPTAY